MAWKTAQERLLEAISSFQENNERQGKVATEMLELMISITKDGRRLIQQEYEEISRIGMNNWEEWTKSGFRLEQTWRASDRLRDRELDTERWRILLTLLPPSTLRAVVKTRPGVSQPKELLDLAKQKFAWSAVRAELSEDGSVTVTIPDAETRWYLTELTDPDCSKFVLKTSPRICEFLYQMAVDEDDEEPWAVLKSMSVLFLLTEKNNVKVLSKYNDSLGEIWKAVEEFRTKLGEMEHVEFML